MFEKFNEGSRRAVITAKEECDRLGGDAIGTEHLLLAITMPPRMVVSDVPVTVSILEELDVEISELRKELEGDEPKERGWSRRELPFTSNARRVFELAIEAQQSLGHRKVRPEHILIGILDDKEGGAGKVLRAKGISSAAVRSTMEENP